MNTDELITHLSRDRRRRPLFAPTAMVIIAAVIALIIALIQSVAWLTPRADLVSALMAENHVFVLKLAFTIGVVFAALPIVCDLSIPGRRLGLWSLLTAAPFAIIMILALRELAGVPTREWSHHVGLASWLECLWQIPALAIPAFAILTIVVRRLAPTDLARTGACIGLVAGGIGAVGYVFHCDDDSIAFIATAYTLAIFEMTILGALLGPRLLRWTAQYRRSQ